MAKSRLEVLAKIDVIDGKLANQSISELKDKSEVTAMKTDYDARLEAMRSKEKSLSTSVDSHLSTLSNLNTKVLNNANVDTVMTNTLNNLTNNFNVASGDIEGLKQKFSGEIK